MDLPVHYEDRLVATISADAQTTRLAYADAWGSSADSFPVSLAMPIRPLEIMVGKDYWTDEDLTPLADTAVNEEAPRPAAE